MVTPVGNGTYLLPFTAIVPTEQYTSRLFIVDGIISLPIALAGYAFIPDLPETSRAFYLSQEVTNSIKNNS